MALLGKRGKRRFLRHLLAPKIKVVRELTGAVDMESVLDPILQKYYRPLPQALAGDVTRYNLPALLKYEDKNSMRFSVEARVPFTDYRLMECALRIPAGYKMYRGWRKFILRKAVEDLLPADIVWRKDKIGFATPEAKWLAGMPEVRESVGPRGCSRGVDDAFRSRVFNYKRINSECEGEA